MICLKSLTFVVSITTASTGETCGAGCDLLEKSYLCGINNNITTPITLLKMVVICLKSLTFVVSITTYASKLSSGTCCDLLEKSYLCGINNNLTRSGIRKLLVVICLKSLTFVVSITTRQRGVCLGKRL